MPNFSSFEEAIKNWKNPPYSDPNIDPTKAPESPTLHDEDRFGQLHDEAFGGWDYPPYGNDYYYLVIHTLLNKGYEPAPPNIRKAFGSLHDEVLNELESTSITVPGWVIVRNHERSYPIRYLIDDEVVRMAPPSKYWLMPVENDNEYVSWTFVFVPKNEDEVLRQVVALSVR